MPLNKKFLASFCCDSVYHVYNRTNNKEPLFLNEENYYYFLRKFKHYISPLADIYAWTLIPNHFHLLIRIKSLHTITDFVKSIPQEKQTKSEKQFLPGGDIHTLIETAFTRFFTSYAMAFNKMYNRTGNLFQRTFKRIEIEKESQFTQAIIYIHANAQKHKLVKGFTLYKWSSYHSIISDQPTKMLREEVLEWFGGKERFIKTHKEMAEYYYRFGGAIEDDD